MMFGFFALNGGGKVITKSLQSIAKVIPTYGSLNSDDKAQMRLVLETGVCPTNIVLTTGILVTLPEPIE